MDLLELAYSLPYFKDFMYSMDQANLTDLMEESGPYTVFAPVQASFATFRQEKNIDHLDDFPAEEFRQLLLYHFIPGRYTLSEMPEGYHPTLLTETSTGNPVDIFVQNDGVFRLNGINVIDEPDLAAVNGYIQSIRYVLELPGISDHLSVNGDFSLFLSMLNRQDLDPGLRARLAQPDPFTLLVPDDIAIQSMLDRNQEWVNVNDIPASVLNDIVSQHFMEKNIVLSDQKGRFRLNPSSTESYIVWTDYPLWTIRDEDGMLLAKIKKRDIQAVNGIIHHIDRVLYP